MYEVFDVGRALSDYLAERVIGRNGYVVNLIVILALTRIDGAEYAFVKLGFVQFARRAGYGVGTNGLLFHIHIAVLRFVFPNRRVDRLLCERAAREILINNHRVARGEREDVRKESGYLVENIHNRVDFVENHLDDVHPRIGEGYEGAEQERYYIAYESTAGFVQDFGVVGLGIVDVVTPEVIELFAEFALEVELQYIVVIRAVGYLGEVCRGVTLILRNFAVTGVVHKEVVD